MNTSFFIARRYLFSKKSINAINFISGISMLGVFVGSAALIIILSVFNGFEDLVLSMYNKFTPEIKIEAAKGKTFDPQGEKISILKKDQRIISYSQILQEKALLRYGKAQYIGLVRGVSENYLKNQLDSSMISGTFLLKDGEEDFAVIGSAVQSYLSVNVHDDFRYLEVYSPKKGSQNALNPADEFVIRTIHPSGVFEVQKDFDDMVLVPMSFARALLNEDNNVSAIEISLKNGASIKTFESDAKEILGDDFIVKNRNQQNQLLYKTLNFEKWAIFMILTFVLIIAIFNIIGSLTMLVIDKRKDIAILSSLGAGNDLVRRIFFTEGMMISMIGCVAGMFVGLIIALVQQKYGIVKMNGQNLVTDSFPVVLKWTDFVLVLGTVLLVSMIASAISSKLSVRNTGQLKEDL